MGINFGEPNTTRWYSGTLSGLPAITGDFTAMAVLVGIHIPGSKHQYFLSVKGAGAAGSLNLLTPSAVPMGMVRVHTATSGQSIQTSALLSKGNSYIVFARRKDGIMHCGFIDINTKIMSVSSPAANTDQITVGGITIGELNASEGTRGYLKGLSAAGIFTRFITDEELIALSERKMALADLSDDVWEAFTFPSATSTITGVKGTELTRYGDSWGSAYDPILLDALPPADKEPYGIPSPLPVYKDSVESSKLVQQVYQSGSLLGTYSKWTCPPMPPARSGDTPGSPINAFSDSQPEYMALWDTLVNDFPEYITKTTLGVNSSEDMDIHLLDFKPERFSNTLIVTCAMHGDEIYGSYLFYLFMNEVCRRPEASRHLQKVRNDTRILLIPVLNPWGAAQVPKDRKNANGVDINRNFDYRWDDYVVADPNHDNKGTAPWSEPETRYVRDLILAHPEAKAYIDVHFLGNTPNIRHFYFYAGSERNTDGGYIHRVIRALRTSDAEEIGFNMSFNPSGYIWAGEKGMYGVNPEWNASNYNNPAFSAPDVTLGVQWFGNIIISYLYPIGY